jgi:N-acetylmuramic acid 6-phosphate etherase
MIDLHATNAKLRDRAVRMVREVTGLDEDAARARLEANEWSVRRAIDGGGETAR